MTVTGGRPLRLVLTDDVELVTRGLPRMLEAFAHRVEIVAADGPGATGDICLVDLDPHDTATRADVATLRRRTHPGRLVVWSWELDPGLVRAALDDGAAGYLAKTLPAAELVAALERIHAGHRVVSTPAPRPEPRPGSWPGREAGLTARESQIVALITLGLSNQEIAERSFLSINSVKSYIRSSYRKMGVSSRSRAVLWGIEHGFREG